MFARTSSIVALFSVFMLASGCTNPEHSQTAITQQDAKHLGDLTEFSQIANDVDVLVKKGDLAQAKKRIKDLELAWDAAESGLKPKAANDWHRLDKAIDQALSALRADAPNKADCEAAMSHLSQTFSSLTGYSSSGQGSSNKQN